MKKHFLFFTGFIVFGLLLGGGFAAFEAHRFLNTPASQTPADVTITILPGATFDRVAWDLKKAGAITDVTRFRLLAQFKDALGKVKAGEFLVNTGWTPERVLTQITEGKAILYPLTLREGLSWWETARAIEEQGFATYEDFKAVIHDPDFLRKYNIPFANAEGFLFPETYLLKKPRNPLDKEQARIVAETLVGMFWKKTGQMWEKQPGQDGVDREALQRLVILASLVERETAVPAERGQVAGVYANRLRLGMLLQCDPTIIYGWGENFAGAIRRSHLDDAGNVYNTYQHAGLPPGPICSPGLESIKAATGPAKHDYMYFVANGLDGGHVFSKTLAEHNAAVQVYRARMREKR